MGLVTRVVIPKEIRENLGLEPGQKLEGFEYDDRIEFMPGPIRKLQAGSSGESTRPSSASTIGREPAGTGRSMICVEPGT